MKSIPPEFHDLLKDENKAYLFLATTMTDGSPQVTPVWFSADDKHILVNTAEGRVKDRNMRARPNVAVCIADPATPYRYLQIRGRVDAIVHEGAEEHINTLSLKYKGKPWEYQPGQVRVIFKILPEKVDAHG
jgi:PPOX class probable F420-dependent enzyme